MDKYKAALASLKRTGSLSVSADDLGVTRRTVKNRVQALGLNCHDFTKPNVRGRNSKKFRTLPNGDKFYFATSTSGQVNLEDIAKSLSRTPWESGLTEDFVPMSEVSIKFSEWVMENSKDIRLAKLALFWYSPAVYAGSVPHEVNRVLTGNFKDISRTIREAVYDNLGLFYDNLVQFDRMEEYSDQWELLISEQYFDDKYNPTVAKKYFLSYWSGIKVISDEINN